MISDKVDPNKKVGLLIGGSTFLIVHLELNRLGRERSRNPVIVFVFRV